MIVINDNMNNYNFNNLDISLPLNSSGSITSTTVDSQGLNGSPLKSEGNMNHHSSISTGTNDDGDHSNGSHHSNGGNSSSSGSNGGSNGHGKDTKDKKKPIPIELTAYGTTPSGKPRLFVCQDCTRAFARLEHLRRHERSHTKEKPFTCGVCQRKFSRRDLLLRHAQKLHAGCADAITRLRRKSVKKIDTDHDADNDSRSSTNGQPTDKKDVDFNLNLFDNHHSINHQLSSFQNNLHNLSQNNPSIFSNQPGNTNHPVHHQKRRSTSDLSKQMFDKKRTRGASFSAQSGANYAANIPEFNDLYTGTDTGNVEFSTPQLMPSTTFDEPSWLHNLSTIPGMTDDVQHNNPKHHGNTQFNLNQNQNNVNPNNNNKDNNNGSDIPNKGEKSNKNFEKFDLQYMLPTATMNSNDLNNTKDFGFGYSFYDVPDSMVTNDFKHNDFKSNNGLTPIKQEFEEDHFPGMNQLSMHQGQNELPNQNQLHNGKPSQNEQESEGINDIFDVNLNFINDIGELTNEIDVNSKFLPNGYSFYGDSVSSSGFGNSPSYGSPNNFLNQSQILNIDNTNSLNNLKISNYSKFSMFTNNLKNLINKSLNKYPINGSINPIIPSNDKLEIYLSYFKNKFLNKFPFIHPSKLNEYEIMMMTSNEDYSNESARVCLPLLVATVGALLSNNKNDSEHLYEASRRTIHIYLESRKLNNQSKNNNPLWLIQSLTLSVVYGLFSDNENNVFIVIRQLNALNSLVKTSIRDKKNFQIFNINDGIKREGEDNHKEIEFNNLINTQSQFRIIFIIYRITSFLLMFYNIPLTLSVNDLNNLQVPNIEDEIIWKFNNVQDFKNFDPLNLKRYNFKDLLLKISKNANNNNLNSIVELKNLSLFSYSTLIHGVFEINQFNNNLNTINILNNLSKLCNNNDDYVVDGTNINHGVLINNYQLMDYSIIVNLIKISSILDFKLLKQQSWLKNYKELIKVFENLNQSIKLNEFSKIDKILDYSLIILKFLIIKFDKSGDQNDYNNISDPINEDGQEMEDEEDISFENDEVNFEKLINIKFINVLNNDPNIILSQSLFQIFSILSLILIQLIKSPITPFTKQLNAKFFKIFEFCKFIQVNYNLPIIFESPNLNNKKLIFNDVYYLLNIGELLLNHYFSNFFRFSIFEKLSINLYQIRKYLSDNENK